MEKNQQIFQIIHYFKLLNEKLPQSCRESDNGAWCLSIEKIFQENCDKLQKLIDNLNNEIKDLKTKSKK